jgi:4-hydroxythreonine-4-phosphate dehydrogenase
MTATLHGQVGALVASGGETARKVLDRWAVSTLLLHGELERGVPVSSTTVDRNRPLTVITKAGDFGQPYTLVHCREWLKQKRNTK